MLSLKHSLQTAHDQAAVAEKQAQRHAAERAEIRAELAAASQAAGSFQAELQSQSSAGKAMSSCSMSRPHMYWLLCRLICRLTIDAAVLRLEKAVTTSLQSQAALAGGALILHAAVQVP